MAYLTEEEATREWKERRLKQSKERAGKVAGVIRKPLSYRLPQSRPRISREKSRAASRAVTGVLGALLPPESMRGAVTYTKKGKKEGGGRGRPHGTYKARFVPGIGTVRVPTHIYRRMMSEVKAKRRLAEAKRQAGIQEQYEAEQIAMQQRATYEQPDSFTESVDMDHEARVADIREQQQYQQRLPELRRQQVAQKRASFVTRSGAMFGKLGGGLWGSQSRDQQVEQQVGQEGEPYSAGQVPGVIHPKINENMYNRSAPQVIVTSGKSIMFQKSSNLLSQANEFNKPNDAVLELGGVKRKRNHL